MKRSLFLSIAGLSILLSIVVHAQDKPQIVVPKDTIRKTDTVKQKTDSVLHATLATSGSINRAIGNISYLLNNDLKLAIREEKYTMSLENIYEYGKDNGVLTNNDYSAAFQINHYIPKTHFFYWGLADYNASHSLKINNQELAGAGGAYSVFDNKKAYLNFSDGFVYDHSDLVLPDSSRLNYSTVRNSFRLSFRFVIQKVFTIDGTDFLQNSLSDGSDYIIRSTTNLSVKLTKWLDFTSSLVYNEQKRTESSNLTFTYGLKIDKYF